MYIFFFLFGAIFVTAKVEIVTVYWNGHSVVFSCILTCGKSKTPRAYLAQTTLSDIVSMSKDCIITCSIEL